MKKDCSTIKERLSLLRRRRKRRKIIFLALLLAIVGVSIYASASTKGNEVDPDEQLRQLQKVKAEISAMLPPCMTRSLFQVTAYEPSHRSCGKWAKYHSTRSRTKPAKFRTIAVDPAVIPLGSLVYIEGLGFFIAEDVGGDIKGKRIDIFMDTEQEALDFGVKNIHAYYQDRACFSEVVKTLKHDREITLFSIYDPAG